MPLDTRPACAPAAATTRERRASLASLCASSAARRACARACFCCDRSASAVRRAALLLELLAVLGALTLPCCCCCCCCCSEHPGSRCPTPDDCDDDPPSTAVQSRAVVHGAAAGDARPGGEGASAAAVPLPVTVNASASSSAHRAGAAATTAAAGSGVSCALAGAVSTGRSPTGGSPTLAAERSRSAWCSNTAAAASAAAASPVDATWVSSASAARLSASSRRCFVVVTAGKTLGTAPRSAAGPRLVAVDWLFTPMALPRGPTARHWGVWNEQSQVGWCQHQRTGVGSHAAYREAKQRRAHTPGGCSAEDRITVCLTTTALCVSRTYMWRTQCWSGVTYAYARWEGMPSVVHSRMPQCRSLPKAAPAAEALM